MLLVRDLSSAWQRRYNTLFCIFVAVRPAILVVDGSFTNAENTFWPWDQEGSSSGPLAICDFLCWGSGESESLPLVMPGCWCKAAWSCPQASARQEVLFWPEGQQDSDGRAHKCLGCPPVRSLLLLLKAIPHGTLARKGHHVHYPVSMVTDGRFCRMDSMFKAFKSTFNKYEHHWIKYISENTTEVLTCSIIWPFQRSTWYRLCENGGVEVKLYAEFCTDAIETCLGSEQIVDCTVTSGVTNLRAAVIFDTFALLDFSFWWT